MKTINLETTFNLKKKILDIFSLTRWRETFDFNFITTILGYIAANIKLDFSFLLVLIANQYALWFMFMINDVEDSKEDATDPKKRARNVISNGTLTKEEGYVYTMFIASIAFILYAFVSYVKGTPLPLIVGTITLLVGHFYSYRKVRLKAIPVIDLISHAYMLAAGLTLAAYFSATGNGNISLLGKLSLAIVFIASMYGQLDNEIRDFEIDVREKVTTLATILGKNISKLLQTILIVITGVLSIYAIHTLNPSTNWVIQSALLLGITEIGVYIFWVLGGKKYQLKQHIHRGLLITTMISLVALNLGIYIQ